MNSKTTPKTQDAVGEPARNPFMEWRNAGYRDLLPIIPPGATMKDPRRQPQAGKMPGVKRGETWSGIKNWYVLEASTDDLQRWHDMGAGVGLIRRSAFLLDIDAYEENQAEMIQQEAERVLGPAPCRVGRWPKRALLYRADGDMSAVGKLRFTSNGKPAQVEVPPQAVVQGIHSGTGKPYTWEALRPFDDLTPVTPEAVASFLEGLRDKLPEAVAAGSADRREIDQAALVVDERQAELLREAVAAIPNRHEEYGYDEWVRFAAALRGAFQDHPEEGEALFVEWSEQADLPEMTEDPARVYHSLNPPFAVPPAWIMHEAARHGWNGASRFWISDEELNEAIAQSVIANDTKSEAERNADSGTFAVLTVADLRNRPPAEWLIERHIPKQSVGFLYSRPGAGKSFLALDMCLHIATGQSRWHDDPLTPGEIPRVLYIAAEGSYGFLDRIEAWEKKHGLAVGPGFLMIEETINFMKAEDVVRLKNTVRANGGRFDLVVVDTVSRALPGADENLQKDMTLFVAACEAVKRETGGAVLGVHHAGKSGDMRGSTVLLGAGDFVFRIDRKAGATVGSLVCEKQKEAPDGWEEAYTFERVALPETAQGRERSSLVPVRCFESIGPDTALTPTTAAAVLRAMDQAWRAGEPWSKSPQTKERFFVRRMASDFGFKAQQSEGMLEMWLSMGVVREEIWDRRNKRKGLRVVGDVGQDVLKEGIFG